MSIDVCIVTLMLMYHRILYDIYVLGLFISYFVSFSFAVPLFCTSASVLFLFMCIGYCLCFFFLKEGKTGSYVWVGSKCDKRLKLMQLKTSAMKFYGNNFAATATNFAVITSCSQFTQVASDFISSMLLFPKIHKNVKNE